MTILATLAVLVIACLVLVVIAFGPNLTERCGVCGKRISDEEYVVNWASCRDCFGAHLDAAHSQPPHDTGEDGDRVEGLGAINHGKEI